MAELAVAVSVPDRIFAHYAECFGSAGGAGRRRLHYSAGICIDCSIGRILPIHGPGVREYERMLVDMCASAGCGTAGDRGICIRDGFADPDKSMTATKDQRMKSI